MNGSIKRVLGGFIGMLAIGLATSTMAAETPTSADGIKRVNAKEAKALQEKGAMMIDTRVASENAEKTVKGAKSIVYKEKSAKDVKFDRTQDNFDLSKLPSDKNAAIVTFCNGAECWKSYKSAVLARDAGYKQVYWLRGGLPEWVAAGLPTE